MDACSSFGFVHGQRAVGSVASYRFRGRPASASLTDALQSAELKNHPAPLGIFAADEVPNKWGPFLISRTEGIQDAVIRSCVHS